MFKKGFTLMEVLISLSIIGILIVVAGYIMGWNGSNYKEKAYAAALEKSILQGIEYAQTLEQPIAICFTLSDGCGAEGILTPMAQTHQVHNESIQEWHLLEALPAKQNIILRTNFPDDRLLIQAGGQSVQRPGAVSVCAMDQELAYTWNIIVSRAGKVSIKKLEGEQSISACSKSVSY